MRTGAVVFLLLLMAVPVRAADPPHDLEALYEFTPAPGAAIPFAEEKRHSAMRLTALGFGARAALARRSWEIGVMLERLSAQLSAIYRFGDLMLTEQGFTVLPPVLAETRQAFRLGLGQDRAASARRVLRIVEPERIVSAAPHWRDYLVRSWRTPAPPAAVLFPRTGPETTLWRQWLAEGWAHGTACQWRSKKGPPRRCKKGPLGGCGLVPVVHGRAPRATRRALNRLTRRRAREGPVGPRGQAWAGWSVQLAVGV